MSLTIKGTQFQPKTRFRAGGEKEGIMADYMKIGFDAVYGRKETKDQEMGTLEFPQGWLRGGRQST